MKEHSALSQFDTDSSLTPVEVEPDDTQSLRAQRCSYCHDVDNGLGLQSNHVGEALELSHLHCLSVCVLQFRVLVTHRHPGGYFGTRNAACRTADRAILAWGLELVLQGGFGCLHIS